MDDLRLAFRSLRRRPGVSLAAVFCLSLGIGVNVALFGLVDALILRAPDGVRDADRLVRVRVGTPGDGAMTSGFGSAHTYPQYEQIASEQGNRLEAIAAYSRYEGTRGEGIGAEPVSMIVVTGSYFDLLGVRPQVGRFFDGEEAAPGASVPVAVLSDRYWEDTFQRDGGVLGSTILVNGTPLTVIGVAPPGFVGVDLGRPDLWIPTGLAARPEFGGQRRYSMGTYWLQLVGRLRPGVDPRGPEVPRTSGITPYSPGGSANLPVLFTPLRTRFYEDQGGRNPVPVWALAISAAVLLLACATVANLLLAQAVGRTREVAIRLALGGSPRRIVRQHLLESLALAVASVGGASALASAAIVLVRQLPVPPLPGLLSGRSLGVGWVLAAVTPLVFGLVPALWAARRDIVGLIRQGADGLGGVTRIQKGFMVAQTTIGFVLLLICGLFVRSLQNVEGLDPGMDVDRILVAYLASSWQGGTSLDHAVTRGVAERVRRLPDVQSAALGSMVPFFMSSRGSVEIPDGRPAQDQPRNVFVNVVSPEYFETFGLALVGGRGFRMTDAEGSRPVAIVSGRFAREHWPGTTPLGECLRLSHHRGGDCAEIVGISADAHYEDITGAPSAVVYLPVDQVERSISSGLTLFLRSRGEPERLIPSVRAEIQSLQPSMPFIGIEPLDSRLRPQRMQWEVLGKVFGAMGALAALLAAIGLYTVVSFIVAHQKRELGIRAALGGGRPALLTMVLRRGLEIAVAGVATGALVGYLTARAFGSVLFGIRPIDPVTYLLVGGGLIVLSLLASFRPALLASRSDPAAVLRDE